MDVEELIHRRRIQILVFSYLYEKCNYTYISDYDWDIRAKELAKLQEEYPDIAERVCYADVFRGFTGDSASGLVYDNDTIRRARMLVGMRGDII